MDVTYIQREEVAAIYSQTWMTAREILEKYPKSIAIVNGSYFGYFDDWSFVPAWLYIQNDQKYADAKDPIGDINLGVGLLIKDNIISLQNFSLQDFDLQTLDLKDTNSDTNKEKILASSWIQLFAQVWPWLVMSWSAVTDLQQDKSHWL